MKIIRGNTRKNTSESKGSCWVHRFCCWVLLDSWSVPRFYYWVPGRFLPGSQVLLLGSAGFLVGFGRFLLGSGLFLF